MLVSTASWNPADQHLPEWLAERLAIDHPGLEHENASGQSLFQALLDHGLIIMVLDGLDEIPESLRSLALTGINRTLNGGQPSLLSSRTDAYRAAGRPADGPGTTLTGVLIASSRTQWPHYTLIRLTLALCRRVPWTLMTFLAEAHTVDGVLRQDGASYQSRHLDMQRRLAATYTADPA